MAKRYELFADEAWTHGGTPLRRYWCLYGGIFGTEQHQSQLDTQLRKAKTTHGIGGEVKWQNVAPNNVEAYTAFVDCLLDAVEADRIKFRQMLCDRVHVRVPPAGEIPLTDLDVQFKLCYQFLKHCFGIQYLDFSEPVELLVRFDTHSSQKHKKKLLEFAEAIPAVLALNNLKLRVSFVQSDKVPRIQVVDLMIGAAGSHGNHMQDIRANGQRGMNEKQKVRAEFCKHIYDRLRAIDGDARGTRAFNWFESTGKDGDRANILHHKVRVWKFKPKKYRIDAGWQNKSLDAQGQYAAPRILPLVHNLDDWTAY